MKKPVQQVRIDWVRIQIPYTFKPVLDKSRDSAHHHELAVGEVIEGFTETCSRLFSILAIDKDKYTNLEFFEYHEGGKPYDSRYSRDGFDLRFNDLERSAEAPVNRIKMGLKLDIQGRGCRYIEHALARDKHDWQWFFMALQSAFPDVTFRRIDIARDYFRFTRHLTPYAIASRFEKERRQVDEHNRRGQFVITRRRNFRSYHSGDPVDGVVKGDTFYLGSPSDDLMLRIYDKDAERIYSHGDTWRKRNKIKQYWYRWEVQASGEVADKLGHLLADGETGGHVWTSCVNRMFAIAPTPLERKRGHAVTVQSRVYDPKDKKYIDKPIEVADWWAEWIDYNATDKYHLTTIVHYSDVENSDNWLEGPVAHSLVVRLVSHILRGGDATKLLEHWIEQGNLQLNFDDINRVKSQVSLLNDVAVKQLTKGGDFSKQVSPNVSFTDNDINKRAKAEKQIAIEKLQNKGVSKSLTLADYLDKGD